MENSPRQRFELRDGRIRAHYGHTVPGRIEHEPEPSPGTLFHGTPSRALPGIREQGLLPRKRQYVHLARGPELAVTIGERREAKPVVLEIDGAAAFAAGLRFYTAGPEIVLTEHVPVRSTSASLEPAARRPAARRPLARPGGADADGLDRALLAGDAAGGALAVRGVPGSGEVRPARGAGAAQATGARPRAAARRAGARADHPRDGERGDPLRVLVQARSSRPSTPGAAPIPRSGARCASTARRSRRARPASTGRTATTRRPTASSRCRRASGSARR